jgi:hypothetical protein
MSDRKISSGKTVAATIFAVIFAIGLLAGESLLRAPEAKGGWVYIKESPKLVVSPVPIPYQAKTIVTIAGSGFEPKQEISLQIELGGVPSDISFMVRPRPVANEFGAFSSQWALGGEIKGKLLLPTAYTLRAEDENGQLLAHAPFVFDPPAKKKAEKK